MCVVYMVSIIKEKKENDKEDVSGSMYSVLYFV